VKVSVFSYDFPHKKSQDFITRLWLENIPVAMVIGAPPVELPYSKTAFRAKPRYGGLIHPARVCDRLGIPYRAMDHNSQTVAGLLKDLSIDVVIIAGARILRRSIIAVPTVGIINFHPGLLPDVRGLDALKWSVYRDVPPGVTAHFIDERVDAGRIILRRPLPVYGDDGWVDLSLRLDEAQVELLPTVVRMVFDRPAQDAYEQVSGGCLNRSMPPEIQRTVMAKFESWKERHTQ